jgi:hypothetical protein
MQVLNEQKKGVDAYLRTPPVYISRKWVLFKGKEYRCFDKVVTREYCFSSLSLSHFIWSSRLLIFRLSQHEVSCSFAWKKLIIVCVCLLEQNRTKKEFVFSLSLSLSCADHIYFRIGSYYLIISFAFSLPIVYSSNR